MPNDIPASRNSSFDPSAMPPLRPPVPIPENVWLDHLESDIAESSFSEAPEEAQVGLATNRSDESDEVEIVQVVQGKRPRGGLMTADYRAHVGKESTIEVQRKLEEALGELDAMRKLVQSRAEAQRQAEIAWLKECEEMRVQIRSLEDSLLRHIILVEGHVDRFDTHFRQFVLTAEEQKPLRVSLLEWYRQIVKLKIFCNQPVDSEALRGGLDDLLNGIDFVLQRM